MADQSALTLTGWQSYFAEPGSVFSLSYLAPAASVCRDDTRAYALLKSVEGLAAFTVTRLNSVAARVPRGGHERTGDVWIAWVVTARGATLGALLPTSLKPCPGVNAAYRLQVVTRHRTAGNLFQVTDARLTDTLERNAGDVIGGAAAGVISTVADTAVRGLLPILVPALIGLILFQRYGNK